MGGCQSKGLPPGLRIMLIGAAVALPITIAVVAETGMEEITTALMAGGIAGAITMAVYSLSLCDFSITECTVSGIGSTLRGVACSL